MELTREQRAVVEIESGRHLVLAPPGTGKTQMLTERVRRALAHGVSAREMLCGTFTIRAAAEMDARLRAELGGAEGPLVGNLHHICHRLLFTRRLVPRSRQVVDGNFRDETLAALRRRHPAPRDFLERHYLREGSGEIDFYRFERDCAEAIDRTLALGAGTPAEFLRAGENPCVGEAFVEETCAAYVRVKEELFALDFDDLLIETYKALRRGAIGKYRWLQVDEVQDLSPLQWAIVEELAASDAVVVLFGDYEQSIYSFLGASTELLDRKAEGLHLHFFETNFRATSYLLDLLARYSFRTLGSSFAFLPLPARYASGEGHLRLMANAGTGEVVGEAARLLASGETDNAAILVQTNRQADEAEACAKARGVPAVKVSGFEFGSRKVFRDLAALMEVAYNPGARVAWSRLVRHFAGRVVASQAAAQALVGEMFALRLDPKGLLGETAFSPASLASLGETAARGRVVVFDTETTGLDARADHIVQLTGVEYVGGRVGRTLNLYLKSPIPMPREAEAIHHISDAFLAKSGIDPAEGIRRFLGFVGGDLLVAHNLRYDLGMLESACRRYAIAFDAQARPMCDTLDFCRRLHPELTSYRLGALIAALGLEGTNSHDALDDVLATGNLFLLLAREGAELVGRQLRWLSGHAAFAEAFASSAAPYFAEQAARLDGPFDLRGELRAFIDYSRNPAHPLYTRADCRRMLAERRVGEADAGDETLADGEEVTTEALMRPLEGLFRFLEARYAHDPRPFRKILAREWDEISKLREADLIPEDAPLVISTIHKAKGLQFDTVFIPSCQPSHVDRATGRKVMGFPSFQVMHFGGDRAENERLLYVGMSRAKRNLILAADGERLSPYLEPCLECFRPGFRDFFTRLRENGGRLRDFDSTDWLARLYSLILCEREGTEPPNLRKWFDDSVPCIRKLAFRFLPRCGHAALVDEVLTAALRSESTDTLASAVSTIGRMRAVRHLAALRAKFALLPAESPLKAQMLGAFAACLPDAEALEALEDAVFDACGAYRIDAARRLAEAGRGAFAAVVSGTEADWQALAPLVTPRIAKVLAWRISHRTPGSAALRFLIHPSEG